MARVWLLAHIPADSVFEGLTYRLYTDEEEARDAYEDERHEHAEPIGASSTLPADLPQDTHPWVDAFQGDVAGCVTFLDYQEVE